MGHDHSHGHEGHAHAHPPVGSRAFAVSVGLNITFVMVEIVAGLLAHSMALLADAAHNLSDVLGLILAWGAAYLARRKPSRRRTYGLRRSTILAALANAGLLLVAVGGVSWEAVGRFNSPTEVRGTIVIVVAAIGVVINCASAAMFAKGRKDDANVRGAFLHLAADAAVSLGVVLAGIAMITTRWSWIDPLVSIVVSVLILGSTWSLLRESMNLALDAVPEGIDPEAVLDLLRGLDGVTAVHDLHIWPMSTTETALTAHLVMTSAPCPPAFLRDVGDTLREKFRIAHSTLQIEPPDAPDECAHAPDDVV